MRAFLLPVLAALVAGCASPAHRITAPFVDVDDDTRVSVSEKPDGFLVAIYYSRFQFLPNQGPIALDCRKRLVAAVEQEAKKRGRPVLIDEDRIEMGTNRNFLIGTTNCIATFPVTWATKPG